VLGEFEQELTVHFRLQKALARFPFRELGEMRNPSDQGGIVLILTCSDFLYQS
jgi:hypothetical protein